MEPAGLHFLPPGTIMNGKKHVDLLNSKLELHMRTHSCEIFKHNGAQCRRSKVVKISWRKRYSNVAGARKQSVLKFDRKRMKSHKEKRFRKACSKP